PSIQVRLWRSSGSIQYLSPLTTDRKHWRSYANGASTLKPEGSYEKNISDTCSCCYFSSLWESVRPERISLLAVLVRAMNRARQKHLLPADCGIMRFPVECEN